MSEELIARAKDFVAGTEKLSKGRDEEDMVPADVGGMRSLASLIDSLATALQEAERENAALLKANEKLAANCLAWSKAEKKDKATLAEAEGKLSAVREAIQHTDMAHDYPVVPEGEASTDRCRTCKFLRAVAAILEGEGS